MRVRGFLRLMVLAVGTLAASLAAQGADASKIPPGPGSFVFTSNPKAPQQTLKVWTYRPKGLTAKSPIVFVMHGVKRNGETYRDNWAPHAEREKFLLVVPEFPEAEYPSESYSQGNIVSRKGEPIDREEWTFTIVEKLFDEVKSLVGNSSEKYYLYGHSAGGQFVHRFVMLMPRARYARAIAANPGFYTMPTTARAYPYGMKNTPGTLSNAIFARDVVVLLGEADTDRNDPNLRKTPEADAQGLTRFERGKTFFKMSREKAHADMAEFNWKLVTVPGVGHSDAKMSSAAVRELFK